MSDPLIRAADTRFGSPRYAATELLGCSAAIVRVQELVRRAAIADGGVLMTAEPGTAVECVARELHQRSRYASGPYVAVECAGADASAIDRLLFGPPHGSAPTDLEAISPIGKVATALGGTLFLQDVTDLPAGTQARLTRIVRDGEVRIDGVRAATNLRLIASASPGIDADVHAHRFRTDLYRRLTAVRIDLPPLRERSEDVPAIAARMLEDCCASDGLPARTFTQTALALLGALHWPGNFRELHDAIGRVVAATPAAVIQVEHLLPAVQLLRGPAPFVPAGNLREARLRFERDYIGAVLQHHGWRMADAAATLGIQRPNLYRKARQLGIPLARLSD
jgi:two-component system nitrogen regulation response regulator NtrX